MRKCRLNPSFKSFLKGIFYFIATISLIAVSITAYTLLVASLSAAFMYYAETFNAMAYFACVGQFSSVDTLWGYAFEAGMGFCVVVSSIIIGASVVGGFLYVIYSEASESYRWRSSDLEYRFQGKKQPWYRVLLSYIIVCETTK